MVHIKYYPAVSIIMPVHNAESYISESIHSILSQSFSDYELIIINDGSTDKTERIVQLYLTDERIKLYSQENCGIAPSLNRALSLATGKYIARADADDLSDRTRLEKQYRYLEENTEAVMVTTDFYKLYPDGSKKLVKLPSDHFAMIKALFIVNTIMHASVMMRTDVLRRSGGYSAEWKHIEDYELWFRLARTGNFANIPEPLSTMRVFDESISALHEIEQVRCGIRLRYALIKSGQFPLAYLRYLIKPIMKTITPRRLLTAYRKFLGKRR